MHVKMLIDRLVTVDGVNTVATLAGEIYKMGDGVAHDLIDGGHAEPAEAASTTARPRGAKQTPAPPAPAELAASPTSLTFAGKVGDELTAQSVSISGEGEFRVVLHGEDVEDWLFVEPLNGTAPASVSVFLAKKELDAGMRSGSISIESGDASVSVGVSVSIAAAAEPAKAIEEPLENKDAAKKPAAKKPAASRRKKT